MIGALDLTDNSASGGYLTIPPRAEWISRYRVTTVLSPSDFPRYCPWLVHEPVGVHRYKPEL
jgi:hypothetical protein